MAAMLVTLAQLWLWAGAAVAMPFLVFGIDRIDEDARGAYIFRTLLIPGILLIWPLVLWRWWVLETGRDDWRRRHLPERAVHGRLWVAVAALIAVTLAAGLGLRQSPPEAPAPVLLEAAR